MTRFDYAKPVKISSKKFSVLSSPSSFSNSLSNVRPPPPFPLVLLFPTLPPLSHLSPFDLFPLPLSYGSFWPLSLTSSSYSHVLKSSHPSPSIQDSKTMFLPPPPLPAYLSSVSPVVAPSSLPSSTSIPQVPLSSPSLIIPSNPCSSPSALFACFPRLQDLITTLNDFDNPFAVQFLNIISSSLNLQSLSHTNATFNNTFFSPTNFSRYTYNSFLSLISKFAPTPSTN